MATKKKSGKEKKPFFFKRWMTALSNVMDRWLFQFEGDKGETMAKTFWWVLIAGFVGGGITIAPQIFASGSEITPAGRIATIISSSLALLLLVMYGYRNIPLFETTKTKILRGVFIYVWGLIGYGLGYMLGAVIVAAVIAIAILWLFLKMFGAMVFGGSGSDSSSSSRNRKETIVLDDGTEVEDTGFGSYRDVHGYETYSRDGDTFTKND